MNDPEKVEGIVLIPGPTREHLNERQLIAYKNHREELIKWLSHMGNDPEKLQGYAYDTAKNYSAILDKFYRWVWEQRDSYTTAITHDDAESFLRELIMADDGYSNSHLHNVKLALKAYFRFRPDTDEWDPEISIQSPSDALQPKNYLPSSRFPHDSDAAIDASLERRSAVRCECFGGII